MPVPLPSERAPLLADRLAAARRGRFVGRLAEIELFRSALLAPELPFAVLYVHGPGGVGKTTLIREYARLAGECGRPVIHLDGRTIESSPPGFLLALRRSLGLEDGAALPVDDWPAAGLWLIDTYELLAPLDVWLRETLLPQLPARSLVVLAGRNPPASAWRTDLEWADLAHIRELSNLRPEESQTYLATRGIPEAQHADLLAFTRGHPLALALVADVLRRGQRLGDFNPRSEPEVVRVLLERLVRDVPSPAHRLALEICVLAWATTERLLSDVVGETEAPELFDWLRRQSFIEQGPDGLYPHDLARDVLDTDLRWRNSPGRRDLIRQLATHLYNRFQEAHSVEQQRIWFDLLYLNRQNPYMRPYFEWAALGTAYAEPATARDHAAIIEMTRQHQGEAGARIVHHWLARQPQAFLAYRDVNGELFGFMAQLTIHNATAEDIATDPAVPAALAFVERHGPLRPGEEVVYLRFWMHQDAFQGVSPAINLTAINSSIYWTTHPKLAWNFIAIGDPEFLEPHFTSIHMWRSPEADFEVGAHRHGVFAHDWRVEPPATWMTVKHDLASVTDAVPLPLPPRPSPLLVLSEQEFVNAVRQALRDFTRPDQLIENPLMRTRLVVSRGAEHDASAVLRELLSRAIASLRADPKSAKLHRALWHTYIEPAPSQEQAAELLGLPFNTYRYHLAKGIEHVGASLWRQEVGGSNDDSPQPAANA
jgi:hypothetical protein